MFILVIIINFASLFSLICAINTIRIRHKQPTKNLIENISYKCGFTVLNIISLILCLFYWTNAGWLIWMNVTSINALILALLLGFYPEFYIKWICFYRSNQA